MEALNIRLDEMPSLKSAHGVKNYQADSSFSMVLDRALNATDGIQSNEYNASLESAKLDAKRLDDRRADTLRAQNNATQKSIDERALACKRANDKLAEQSANAKLEESRRNAKASEEKNANKAKQSAQDVAEDANDKTLNADSAKATNADDASDAKKLANAKNAKTEEADTLEEASKLALADLENATAEEASTTENDATTAEILMANAFVAKNSSENASNAQTLQNAQNAQDTLNAENAQELSATSKKSAKKTDALLANILSTKSQDTSTVANANGADANNAAIALNANKNAKSANAEPVFTVIDERTMAENAKDAKDAKNNFVTSVQYDGANTAEMNMHLPQSSVQGGLTAKASVDTVQMGKEANFGAMLSSEIKNNASDFVKTGLITLKDNNQGTINLILHPEELGNVKIKLELSDSIITGRIIVQSEEAFGAFKDNIESLRQAFVSQGFEAAGFELSYQGGDASGNNHEGTSNEHNAKGIVYSDGIPSASSEEMSYNAYFSTAQVNVVV